MQISTSSPLPVAFHRRNPSAKSAAPLMNPLPRLPPFWNWECWIIICLFAICLRAYAKKRGRVTSARELPSPKGSFILGHTLLLPWVKPWEQFWRWSTECGPVFQLRVFGRRVIIVNTLEAADELLNKRSRRLSTRPFRVMSYLAGYDRGLGLMTGGKAVAQTRKMLHEVLGPKSVQNLGPLQAQEVERFIRHLLFHPSDLHSAISLLSSSSMLSATIGYNARSHDDPMLIQSEKVAENVAMLASSGKFWIDAFPFLARVPTVLLGGKVVKAVHKFRLDLDGLLNSYNIAFQNIVDDPHASHSLTSHLLSKGSHQDEEHVELVKYANLTLYAGAVTTTASAISVFFLTMILYPDAQKKAQMEIDKVVGNGRLPNMSDRQALPYVEALVREVLRWYPPVPLTSRYMSDDEKYREFNLPAGTSIIANVWAMTRDPLLFSNPHEFSPERFLNGNELNDKIDVVYRIVFGFGRRVCPGVHYSNNGLWLSICLSLAAFDITAPLGEDGEPRLPEPQFKEGYFTHLEPFAYHLRPRLESATILQAMGANDM